MGDWIVIGVPGSAGAHHAAQDQAPEALRAAGLLDRLAAAGESVRDTGNLPRAPFAVDHDHPGARNLAAAARVAREMADAVAAAAGTGRLAGLDGVVVDVPPRIAGFGTFPVRAYATWSA
jgi:arginase